MSDLLCAVCGEPWDLDTLHEEAASRSAAKEDLPVGYDHFFRDVCDDFTRRGCEALDGGTHNGGTADPRIALVYEVLGNDIDGCAAEFADLDL